MSRFPHFGLEAKPNLPIRGCKVFSQMSRGASKWDKSVGLTDLSVNVSQLGMSAPVDNIRHCEIRIPILVLARPRPILTPKWKTHRRRVCECRLLGFLSSSY